MTTQFLPIPPGTKRTKTLLVKTVLTVLGRAFQSAARLDPDIRREISDWEDGFTVMMKVLPSGPRMGLEMVNGTLKCRGSELEDADLVVNFKNVECAFLVFTAQVGTARAFAERRLSVKGDLARAMAFTRCLNILEGYLFPWFVNKMILKRLPPMPLYKQAIRLWVLSAGVVLGK